MEFTVARILDFEKELNQRYTNSVEPWIWSSLFAGGVMLFVTLTQFLIRFVFQVFGFLLSCAVWYFENAIHQFSLLFIAALIIYYETTIIDYLVPEAWARSNMVYKIRVFENQNKKLTWTLAIGTLLRMVGCLLRMLQNVVLYVL